MYVSKSSFVSSEARRRKVKQKFGGRDAVESRSVPGRIRPLKFATTQLFPFSPRLRLVGFGFERPAGTDPQQPFVRALSVGMQALPFESQLISIIQ